MQHQDHWIGHPTAARRLTDDGVLYRDPENQSLTILLGAFPAEEQLFRGANLWKVDRFVEGLEASADSMAPEMRATLDKVRKLGKEGNWPECRLQAKTINTAMYARRELENSTRRADILQELLQQALQTSMEAAVPTAEASQTGAKAARPDAGLTKRERQIRAIEATADAMNFPRLDVPAGGKTAIKDGCKARYPDLFGAGDDPFLDAWKEASKTGRVGMTDRDKFARR